ncbi:hypothetical protein RISK_002643 [Rhodopirellula islandica]|uniref:Uncharacterized protein n=1 Tax=Rhodopirellula islandica TaxID=595434 RepID=A0A0J1BFF6_RHOIS|nr:hypothetical protein RISK_002643 [Rhodopirellula islandica]
MNMNFSITQMRGVYNWRRPVRLRGQSIRRSFHRLFPA